MKKAMKKLLCVVLVLMMTLPLLAFPASADAYDEAADGALLYEANFNGNTKLKGAWDGMKYLTPSGDGTSVQIKAGGGKKGVADGDYGTNDLPGFSIAGKTHTVVFTLTAARADQEIGFLPDDKVGFIIVPGENSYRFVDTNGESGTDTVIKEGTYEGVAEGTKKQTYAIEIKSEGAGVGAKIVAYNLCVMIDEEWVVVCEMPKETLAGVAFDWFYMDGSVYEDDFSIRFYRNRKVRNTANEDMMTVSDFKIYKGLVATGPKFLYELNFNGDDNMGALVEKFTEGGMITITPSEDGRSVSLTEQSKNWSSARAQMNGLNIQNGSYTFVFTVTAGDNNEEVGFLFDHQTGFVVNPGQNMVRYTNQLDKVKDVFEPITYKGTGELTQTYAIEIAGEGEGTTDGDPNVTITHYKLYNVTRDESGAYVWNLAADISANPGLDGFFFDWGYAGDCDANLYAAFSRDRKNYNEANNDTITISNFKVYKGLVTKSLSVDTRAYYQAADGALLYTATFNAIGAGGDGICTFEEAWAGMTATPINDGQGVVLKPNSDKNKASVYRAKMNETHYPVTGNTYTMVFTVTASDADEEIGFYPDWNTGFVVIPGKNQFRYNVTTDDDRAVNDSVVGYTKYDGTGSLTQTYAVEFKVNTDFTAAEYNLYVAQDGKWVLLYSLNANELAKTGWGGDPEDPDDETVIAFYRDTKIDNQNGTVTVSDVNVYKGFAAKSGKAAVPGDYIHKNYGETEYGDLIYVPNLGGDSVLVDPKDMWTGLNDSVNADGTAVTLKPWNTNTQAGAWGGDLSGYSIAGKAYTVVFDARINANAHEIAFMPDGRSGFVISPAYKKYRFVTTFDEGKTEDVITTGEYSVTKGEWDETFAIEWKVDEDFNVVAYNLYISYAGEWVCICKLTAEQLALLTAPEDGDDKVNSAWNADNDVFGLVFVRNQPDKNTVIIKDVEIYKGLVATTGVLPVEFKTLAYDKADNGDKLYEVDFNGTSDVFKFNRAEYDGMTYAVSNGGRTIGLAPTITPSVEGSVWSGEMLSYKISGNAYTVVFTVDAPDNQSVGIFFKWKDGFFVNPMNNTYSFGHCSGAGANAEKYVEETTYDGNGAAKQTYAIEFASGTNVVSGTKLECTKYNLYVLQDGVWNLICELDDATRQKISWDQESVGDFEFMVQLARVSDGNTNTGNVYVSDMVVYKGNSILPKLGLIDGAAVRLTEDSTGIRFGGAISKTYYDELVAEHGKENVKVGIIIAPTDYIHTYQVAFTKEAFDAEGVQYLMIDGKLRPETSYYRVSCAMTNIKPGNLERNFSARLYVMVNGEIEYSAYSHANNSRSIATVAERAYNDVKSTQDSIYKNSVTLDVGVTAYSPYTNDERNILSSFFTAAEGAVSLSVMTYNIRTYDEGDIWDQMSGKNEGWEGRDPVLALETITELMPDVVGLQEDDSNLEAEYKNVPALANNYVLYNEGGNGNENNGIWVKKGITVHRKGTVYYKTEAAKYPDEENITGADFTQDTKGDNEEGRFFRWVLIEKNGEKFLVVNTHLHFQAKGTSEAKDPVNKALRKAQATIIRLWLANSEEAAGCANRIVMGDMNSQGDSQEMKYGLDQGTGSLDLAANDAIIKGDVGGTLIENNATYDHDGDKNTAEITNPNRFNVRQAWVYDHIFYSAETLTAYEFSVVDNYDEGATTRYPSDHLPVVAKFIAK